MDFVSEEAEIAGKGIKEYLDKKGKESKNYLSTVCGNNISYIVPQKINQNAKEPVKLFFRVKAPIKNAVITIKMGDKIKRINKIAVAPGEMEYAIIKPEDFKTLKEIVVSVDKKGENNG